MPGVISLSAKVSVYPEWATNACYRKGATEATVHGRVVRPLGGKWCHCNR